MLTPRTKRSIPAILSWAHLPWQLVFFGGAVTIFLAVGFWTVENHVLRPGGSFAAYSEIFTTARYRTALLNSLRLAVAVAFVATALATPVAHVLAFGCSPKGRQVLLILFIAPFLTNYVIRMFGWQTWLSNGGLLSELSRRLFGVDLASGLLYTETAVVIGLLSAVLPLAVLLQFLSMSRIDPVIRDAARNLGASRSQVFIRLDVWYAIPGIVLSILFSFLLTIGDFVSSSVLGGNNKIYFATAIQDRIRINEWPTAAALGTVLLITAGVVVCGGFWLLSRLARQSDRE